MVGAVAGINFSGLTGIIPSFGVVILTCFTYNLGVGITAGFVLYVFLKLISGKTRDLTAGLFF